MAAPTTPSAPTQAPPSPDRIMDTFWGMQKAHALKAAVDLDIFTALSDGPLPAEIIAEKCGLVERGARILCDFLTVQGFLTKSHGKYALLPDSAAFLNRKSPMFIGSMGSFLLSEYQMDGYLLTTESVRRGGSAVDRNGLDPEHPMWVEFAKHMAPMMMLPAQVMAGFLSDGRPIARVLDIAAGHGVYGIAMAQKNPDAHVYAVDWANVLEFAKQNAGQMGVGDRYHTIPGSAFDVDLGEDFDVVLLPNFLHHFDVPTNEELLRRVHAALNPGGRVAIAEFVPNDDRVSPPMQAAFSLTMLVSTPSGDAYTHAELESMLTNTGFSNVECKDLAPTPSTLITAVK